MLVLVLGGVVLVLVMVLVLLNFIWRRSAFTQSPRLYHKDKSAFRTPVCAPPLRLQGPGLAPGSHVSDTTLHVDLAPTVMALAGGGEQDWTRPASPVTTFRHYNFTIAVMQ